MGRNAACRVRIEAAVVRMGAPGKRSAQVAHRFQSGDEIGPLHRTKRLMLLRIGRLLRVRETRRFSLKHAAAVTGQGSKSGKAAVYRALGCQLGRPALTV